MLTTKILIISTQVQNELSKIGLSPIQSDFLIAAKLIGLLIIILSLIKLMVLFGQKENEIEAFTTFTILIIHWMLDMCAKLFILDSKLSAWQFEYSKRSIRSHI
ncbi:hypothetical protein BpHYR1_026868 [Brachionus plicatilis]|uniref:Uncharacterized protein n=1 Tax=Brachionus plicatilis TaxID=10195 RepID=A0A3M7P4G2_BRAPC|nr:hypothetical protein BpHYR1_026868 [Brachionus plicatilis]